MDLLAPRSLRTHGLLDVDFVQQLLKEHLGGRRSWAAQLWTILMFQAWLTESGQGP
jgi:asparagine synthase (glutamine-hydrolysing)